MFRKGMSVSEMRTSSLIHEHSFKSLVELPEFEPDTYNKLLKRIKGISFAQETGKRAKMFRARKLPKNFNSWLVYRDFLIETHPNPQEAEIFRRRFARHLQNEWVGRQQVRQLLLNDTENNVPVKNRTDPRDEWIAYYMENL
jgi:predicted phosphoadenosine phosphosulfate sulfurtransferase